MLISSVSDDSPAAKAGLRAGDIITAVDGEKLDGLRRSVARDKQERGRRRYADRRRAIKSTDGQGDADQGRTYEVAVRNASRMTAVFYVRKSEMLSSGGASGQIVIPHINIPTIPAINVTSPEISLPVIPEINDSHARECERAKTGSGGHPMPPPSVEDKRSCMIKQMGVTLCHPHIIWELWDRQECLSYLFGRPSFCFPSNASL